MNARGVQVVAISVDPPEINRTHTAKQGFTFMFLSDVKAEVVRRYDLLHPAGFEGADISRPGEFLIDPTGTVRWVNLTENYNVRMKADDLLKALDELGVKEKR